MSKSLDDIAWNLYVEDRNSENEYVIPRHIFIMEHLRELYFKEYYNEANKLMRKKKINKLKNKI